jgi:hypothetical protein
MGDISLLHVSFDPSTWGVTVRASAVLLGLLILGGFAVAVLRGRAFGFGKQMELDEAEFGIGNAKVKLRPNLTDRQVAYAIWVELSTRKIGLEIDLERDVISEVYASWYEFFSVTRELLKTVPVSRVGDPSTRKIIRLSIDILNEGLRPHLTTWQARFRRWFEREMANDKKLGDPPQAIQAEFPAFEEMSEDLLKVNARLVAYRRAMSRLVYND